MRFTATGPAIPNSLLIARDQGDVIFFCGAGVSQANARLPNFEGLAKTVMNALGSAKGSAARRLLEKAVDMGRMAGVGGLLATDRVFSLLEREFEVHEVRAAIARAIAPGPSCGLEAHRLLLDLARSNGVVKLVTTNFDLLFEECDPALLSTGPPHLPDPRSDREFHGIVHLHGRVDADYSGARDEEFVVSSADFGRAYLADGWATRFIQALMSRYRIVFIGYSADDPPVQYLLEALNLKAGSRSQLFAFQSSETGDASALWEHRGVEAIPFDPSGGFVNLWETLGAWAVRAKDLDGWYSSLLKQASDGPIDLAPHVRGQVAHLASTREGARRIAQDAEPLHPAWLLVFDKQERYAPPIGAEPDAFEKLRLDDDVAPDNEAESRGTSRRMPVSAWDAFSVTTEDRQDGSDSEFGRLADNGSNASRPLHPRIASLARWIVRVADSPITLWWAAGKSELHPELREAIADEVQRNPQRFPEGVLVGWRRLLESWEDRRPHPDAVGFNLLAQARGEGWSSRLVREFVAIQRPTLRVDRAFRLSHPLTWSNSPDFIVRAEVDYPRTQTEIEIPDAFLEYAIALMCSNFQHAIVMERELRGDDRLHFYTTRGPDGSPELWDSPDDLTRALLQFQKLFERWAQLNPEEAIDEVLRWSKADRYLFARLRIWSASRSWMTAQHAARILLALPDEVFWSSFHTRDLLYTIRDRWDEFSKVERAKLEHRLLTSSYPWKETITGGPERARARERLNYLHWLSQQGVRFSFDLDAEVGRLRIVAPDWSTRAGDEAADSHAPHVYGVASDESYDALLDVPLSEVLSISEKLDESELFERIDRRAFRGLSKHRPARAFKALSLAARAGKVPQAAWYEFLHAEMRPADKLRLIKAICRRLCALPINEAASIIHPVCSWMCALANRFYDDAHGELTGMFQFVIRVLDEAGQAREHRTTGSWADEALNGPVGDLYDLLMKDPATKNLEGGDRLPGHWLLRVAQLLRLPGTYRQHALVMFSQQATWLYHWAPAWTDAVLLTAAENGGPDSDAFWDGILWTGRRPQAAVFDRLRSTLLEQARQARLRDSHGRVLAAFVLSAWLSQTSSGARSGGMADDEVRELLIHCSERLRSQFVWHLEQLLSADDGRWRSEVVRFLVGVWPNQRAIRTPTMSGRLVDLAMMSGDLMPDVARAILPRLVPMRGGILRMSFAEGGVDRSPAVDHAEDVLDLLWSVLAEDARQWPYRADELIAQLEQHPETQLDARLSELRLRRSR